MPIHSHQRGFAINRAMQLSQCFARATPIFFANVLPELSLGLWKQASKSQIFLTCLFPKKSQGCSKNSQNFKTWLQISQIGKPATQELKMRIKYAGKLSIVCCVYMSRKLSFPFPLLRHYKTPDCYYVKNCCFEFVQQFYHATELGNVTNALSACADQP